MKENNIFIFITDFCLWNYCKILSKVSLCPPVPQFPGNTNVMVQHIFDNSQRNQDEEDGEEDEQIKRQ